MTPRRTALLSLKLLLAGAGWGFTMSMTKIAVIAGHLHFGLIHRHRVLGLYPAPPRRKPVLAGP